MSVLIEKISDTGIFLTILFGIISIWLAIHYGEKKRKKQPEEEQKPIAAPTITVIVILTVCCLVIINRASVITTNTDNTIFDRATEQPITKQPEEKSIQPPSKKSYPIKQDQILLQAVYLESVESNFNQRSTIIVNKLESALSEKGYSFTDNQAQARFKLKITAITRHHNSEQGLTVCFVDVAVGLFDVSRNKSVFKDEFSQKGISATREAAGRKAIEDAVPIIVNNIPPWDEIIKN